MNQQKTHITYKKDNQLKKTQKTQKPKKVLIKDKMKIARPTLQPHRHIL